MIDKVKIGCYTYTVQEVDCVSKFEPIFGEIDYLKRTIRIDKELTDEDKMEVLIHEIIHSLDKFFDIKLEEEQVTKLGLGFAMVIKDNPELFRGGI